MDIVVIPSWYSVVDKPNNGIFFRDQAEALVLRGHHVTIAIPI